MNLVVCGLATFAATVGYACSRKLTGADSNFTRRFSGRVSPNYSPAITSDTASASEPKAKSQDGSGSSKPDGSALPAETLTQSPSLKRKRAEDEENEESFADVGYPDNLQLIYPPKKRSRTPSSESESAKVVAEIVPSPSPAEAPEDPKTPDSSSEDESVLPTPPPITPDPSPHIANERPSTPQVVFGSSATISSPLPKTIQPSQRPVTSKAFSAFVTSGSAFSVASPKSGSLKPAWSMPDLNKNTLEAPACNTEESTSSHVLVAATASKKSVVERLTGEEHEDVELELKGVKMFIKRGDKPFSDGMQGHIKLLSDKETHGQRLLFRREPLWQVSMNVRMHPTTRCTYNANENVLRIIITESVDKKDGREIVIYALKPGRSSSKQDLKEFAEALINSPELKANAKP
ncbi:hypothetical protein H0H87_005389 [Tephrocybe sp. NHM501043]|nr:hypothetical protein H0H87_005389 [Tephrocybe sp. NHM501043]